MRDSFFSKRAPGCMQIAISEVGLQYIKLEGKGIK